MDVQINEHIDVALITLNAFFLFFVGLIIYLRREDRREGFPLEDEMTGRLDTLGGPLLHGETKYFKLPFGHGTAQAPAHGREPVDIAARRFERFPGAPYVPTGDPLVDGVGPAAYANRAKRPDIDWEGHPRVVPMGAATEFWIVKNDPDPRGMPVIGADGKVAGTVGEVWIDKADRLIRYLEVALADSGRSVLAPMFMATIERKRGRVVIDAITAAQFANAPEAGANGTVTLYDEERISAYFGGGYLYATPERQEPFL